MSGSVSAPATTSTDKETTVETLWDIWGTNDELEARVELGKSAPLLYFDTVNNKVLWRLEHRVEQVGDELYEGSITYGLPADEGQEESDGGFTNQTGDSGEGGGGDGGDGGSGGPGGSLFQFSFDTSAQVGTITQSLGTTEFRNRNFNSHRNLGGAINVTGTKGSLTVAGVNILAPTLKWSETHDFPAMRITHTGYVKTLASMYLFTDVGRFWSASFSLLA